MIVLIIFILYWSWLLKYLDMTRNRQSSLKRNNRQHCNLPRWKKNPPIVPLSYTSKCIYLSIGLDWNFAWIFLSKGLTRLTFVKFRRDLFNVYIGMLCNGINCALKIVEMKMKANLIWHEENGSSALLLLLRATVNWTDIVMLLVFRNRYGCVNVTCHTRPSCAWFFFLFEWTIFWNKKKLFYMFAQNWFIDHDSQSKTRRKIKRKKKVWQR